jgi:hypothetical protein
VSRTRLWTCRALLELEQERTGVRLKLRLAIGREHKLFEEFCIKKPWIRLTGPHTIPGLLGIARNRDLLPHLEAHLKVFGDLAEIALELVCGRRSVERRVVTHGPEQWLVVVLVLAILAQTFLSKLALGIFPFVDLALPAFVGPGEVPSRINGESEWGMVRKLYSRFGGVLNGVVKLQSYPTYPTNRPGTLLLNLPSSKFGLLLVEFMPICPPNEVLNRLIFEERMAKETLTTGVVMELSPEDRQRSYLEEKTN